ncbi:TspO/MBR family protein [Hephaestia sp. GCM10023244]|uniref:TspO/MBR family protein n=1 Tax=unclassified Hephaestia TaxID=2631281 RepID=UPI0020778CCB|nr:TspO/MBR family protein [Hephaestia sp. MAHUQ-44]MCM8731956.1 tryptophan-rich sensory protein [Hephaestia sp. MAHUQ-44]
MTEIASRAQLRLSFLRWAVVTVPLILFLGFFSGRLVPAGSENGWYAALAKPSLTPPDWLFPVAWTILYVLEGVALAIILHARGARGRGLAIALFVVQFALSLAWTPIFFGAHKVVLALAIIVVMALLAIATTLLFGRIRRGAAWLMVPYIAWICFAGMLTFGIHQLNPDAQGLVPSSSTTQIEL